MEPPSPNLRLTTQKLETFKLASECSEASALLCLQPLEAAADLRIPYNGDMGARVYSRGRPFFNGIDYRWWKAMMEMYLPSMDYDLWMIVKYGPKIPMKIVDGQEVVKMEEEYNEEDKKKAQLNAMAKYCIARGISLEEYENVESCATAKEMWDRLRAIHEETDDVIEAKIEKYVTMYERFQMKPKEKIRDFFSRFMNILNKLEALGQTYPPRQQVRKVLIRMTEKWDIMVKILFQYLKTREMTLYELRGKLEAHEISYFDGKEKGDDRKRVAIKFSTQSSDSEGDEDEQDSSDDDLWEMKCRSAKKSYRGAGKYRLGRKKFECPAPKKVKKCYR